MLRKSGHHYAVPTTGFRIQVPKLAFGHLTISGWRPDILARLSPQSVARQRNRHATPFSKLHLWQYMKVVQHTHRQGDRQSRIRHQFRTMESANLSLQSSL